MKILLLGRHGVATTNLESPFDLPLSDKGKKEAEDMAYNIKCVVSDFPLTIWSSTAKRASETALIVKELLEESGSIVTIEFFDELWSDETHSYKEDWINEYICSFQGDVLLIIAHAEISEYAVSLGCDYIPLSTGDCMMVRGDWALKL